MKRYLDDLEIRSLDNAPSYVVEYSGELDETVLDRSFELVCLRHPVLRGLIEHDGPGYLLHVPPEHQPKLEVHDGGEETLLRIVRGRWDSRKTLAQLVLVRGDRRGFVAFRLDHAIADGGNRMAMFFELWQHYHNLKTAGMSTVEPGDSLPRSPEHLLHERLHGTELIAEPGRGKPPNSAHDLLEGRIHLSTQDTRAVVRTAKQAGISVHALVSGAILAAHRDQGAADGPVAMMYWSPVNVRNRLTPPVGPTETTNLSLIHEALTVVEPDAGPVAIGRTLKTTLDQAIANHELPTGPPSTAFDTTLERHLAIVLVSNYGVMPAFAGAPGLRIVDFRTLSPAKVGTYPSYPVYTYGGRLTILSRYPGDLYSPDDAAQLHKRITANLLQEAA